jgi:hypothetical protein
LVVADLDDVDFVIARVPVMDTTRARTELEWTPRHNAVDGASGSSLTASVAARERMLGPVLAYVGRRLHDTDLVSSPSSG